MTSRLGDFMVVFTTVLAWAFCLLYHVRQPWWTSHVGRHIMTYSAVVAAVLTLSSARLIVGAPLDAAWFRILRLIVFCGVPVAIIWRIAIVLRAPRGRRKGSL